MRRSEPTSAVKLGDDLWVGVKCQSNPEIAGSPRKVYGDRGNVKRMSGRDTGWVSEGNRVYLTKLRITIRNPLLDNLIGLS